MKRQRGFTLIELIIVMVIIGILLAVFIPTVKEYLSKRDSQSTIQVQKSGETNQFAREAK